MAADLVTKIKIDSKQFDSSIDKSKKQIKSFENEVSGFAKSGVASIAKFAGGFGVALTAMDSFNKAIRSNQASSDALDNTLNAAKGTVDVFFRSLATGDWSVFQDGIQSTYSELHKLSKMMDDLADKKLSLGYIRKEDLRDVEKYEAIAKDATLTINERKEAAEKMAMSVQHLNKNTKEYAESLAATLTQQYKSIYGIDIDKEDLDYFFKFTNFGNKTVLTEIENYKKGLEELEKQYTVTTTMQSSAGATSNVFISDEGKKAIENYKEQNNFLYAQSVLLNENDEKRKQTLDMLNEQLEKEREIYSLEKRANMTANRINKQADKITSIKTPSIKTSTSTSKATTAIVAPTEITPIGSLQWYDEEITRIRKLYMTSTDEGLRKGYYEAIKKLETEKAEIDLTPKIDKKTVEKKVEKATPKGSLKWLDEQYAKQREIYENATSDGIRAGAEYAMQRIDKQRDKISIVQQDSTALDYMTAFSSLMSNMGNITDNAAASWMTYTANVLSSVGAMLPAVASLFGLEASLGIAKQSSIPFPMNIIAMAATAAGLIASLAQIPKFASGGIVPGNNYNDGIHAMLSSGEMVLNKHQQGNLFNLLDGGNKGINGNITFTLRGKELVGVFDNYNKKTSRY